MAKYRTQPVATPNLPPGIPYIIGNEAAERFSFYGMRTILVVFMSEYLHWMTDDPNAVAMAPAMARVHFHDFVRWVYLTPMLGALLADGLFGKYNTIIWLSLVYCLGHLSLALMGTPPFAPETWMFAGLALIALGSGGIKPCVSANVGDQFGQANSHWLSKVYGWFYFSINAGSFISTALTPWLLRWYGPHWAFGVPGVLMAIATLIFWMGRYKYVHVPADGPRFLKEVFSFNGLWTLAKLCVIFVFVAVFWGLYDQTSSAWVQQAADLNLQWLGFTVLPAQIQVANPVLILLFIPLFDQLIYPMINRFFTLTPIRKINMGFFVAAASFAVSTAIQRWIEAGSQPSFLWQLFAYVLITAAEVMVSITALEFAYTQAPRRMKSIIMALSFAAISLGNTVVLTVNQWIQIPNQLESVAAAHDSWFDPTTGVGVPTAEQQQQIRQALDINGQPLGWESLGPDAYQYVLAGTDGVLGTLDDIRVVFDRRGVRRGVVTAANETLIAARDRIQPVTVEASGSEESPTSQPSQLRWPETSEGQRAIDDLRDPWNNAPRYFLINRRAFRVVSLGADGQPFTPDDIVLVTELPEPPAAEKDPADETWLERRQRELRQVRQDRGGLEEIALDIPGLLDGALVGGLTTLEGVRYYWFFTQLMFWTAVVFVVVGLLYRPKEYLQIEAPEDSKES